MQNGMLDITDPSRRKFLLNGLTASVGAAVVLAARPALALPRGIKGVRAMAFHNLHTDEKLSLAYWRNGTYDRAALARINHILRDFRSGDVYPIHPALIDLLHDLQIKLGNDNPFEIISGYRSPRTNAMLANNSGGVANHSYHMRGMAIDIRQPGTGLSRLQKTALTMSRGGVGYYPTSNFVHVDVGPLRRW